MPRTMSDIVNEMMNRQANFSASIRPRPETFQPQLQSLSDESQTSFPQPNPEQMNKTVQQMKDLENQMIVMYGDKNKSKPVGGGLPIEPSTDVAPPLPTKGGKLGGIGRGLGKIGKGLGKIARFLGR